jgi:hypothetical protein
MGAYGNAWDSWKPHPGENWFVGANTFACNSLMDVDEAIFAGADVIYSDPPWSQGNLKMFYTKGKLGGPPLFEVFIRRIAQVARNLEIKALCLEMGVKQHKEEIAILEDEGFKTSAIYHQTYGSPARPNLLWCSGVTIHGQDYRHGQDAIRNVAAHLSEGFAYGLDVCCGVGIYPFTMLNMGFKYVGGVELIPRKFAVLLDRGSKSGLTVKLA